MVLSNFEGKELVQETDYGACRSLMLETSSAFFATLFPLATNQFQPWLGEEGGVKASVPGGAHGLCLRPPKCSGQWGGLNLWDKRCFWASPKGGKIGQGGG